MKAFGIVNEKIIGKKLLFLTFVKKSNFSFEFYNSDLIVDDD